MSHTSAMHVIPLCYYSADVVQVFDVVQTEYMFNTVNHILITFVKTRQTEIICSFPIGPTRGVQKCPWLDHEGAEIQGHSMHENYLQVNLRTFIKKRR